MTWASHILSEPQLLHLHNGLNNVPEPFGKGTGLDGSLRKGIRKTWTKPSVVYVSGGT